MITCFSDIETGIINIKYFGAGEREHVLYGPLIVDNKTMKPKQVETIDVNGIEIPVDACWLETAIFGIEQSFAGRHGLKKYIQTRQTLASEINTKLVEEGIVPDGLAWNY